MLGYWWVFDFSRGRWCCCCCSSTLEKIEKWWKYVKQQHIQTHSALSFAWCICWLGPSAHTKAAHHKLRKGRRREQQKQTKQRRSTTYNLNVNTCCCCCCFIWRCACTSHTTSHIDMHGGMSCMFDDGEQKQQQLWRARWQWWHEKLMEHTKWKEINTTKLKLGCQINFNAVLMWN